MESCINTFLHSLASPVLSRFRKAVVEQQVPEEREKKCGNGKGVRWADGV